MNAQLSANVLSQLHNILASHTKTFFSSLLGSHNVFKPVPIKFRIASIPRTLLSKTLPKTRTNLQTTREKKWELPPSRTDRLTSIGYPPTRTDLLAMHRDWTVPRINKQRNGELSTQNIYESYQKLHQMYSEERIRIRGCIWTIICM